MILKIKHFSFRFQLSIVESLDSRLSRLAYQSVIDYGDQISVILWSANLIGLAKGGLKFAYKFA